MLTRLFTRYALERTDSSIKVWFWSRNDELVPPDVKYGGLFVDTDIWVSDILVVSPDISHFLYSFQGTPFANFPSTTSCDLASHFDQNNIIINLTFCTYSACRCASSQLDRACRRELGW